MIAIRTKPTILREFFTMTLVALESLIYIEKDILIVDSFNMPFTISVLKLFGLRTISYVHYPLIQACTFRNTFSMKYWYHRFLHVAYEMFLMKNELTFVHTYSLTIGKFYVDTLSYA